MSLAVEIAIILFLVVLNGWFAMSEIAIVSSRRARLAALVARGSKGAKIALTLADNPGRFLSAVQVGITLVGVIAGAYSGATLAAKLAAWITVASPPLAEAAEALALAVVVGAITYASLIVGELVPKQIALAAPENTAAFVARPLAAIVKLASPLVWFLERSSRLVLRLLRVPESSGQVVTEEEVKAMIAEGTERGVFEPQEKELIAGVMRFGDRKIRGIMTPRQDVVWIDMTWPVDRVMRTVRHSTFTRFPVLNGGAENVVGVVQAKDLLDAFLDGGPLDIRPAIRPLEVVQDHAPALRVLDLLKRAAIPMALVVDEYGSVEGIVTATDILSAILGSLNDGGGEDIEGTVLEHEDGLWHLDGDAPVDVAAERMGCRMMAEEVGAYTTVAGFVIARSRRIPSPGDVFEWDDWRFEVTRMEGRRIVTLLASRHRDQEEKGLES